ncbi:MAG TPA: cellulase family glycosylhydrolase [Solirubrobacteraceae bacterium]|jgi:hypothetical protein|nr:cellulase family glycosylhydrolase [Solirubrobacteraceae bacterium]
MTPRTLVLAVLLALAAASPASASKSMEVGIADDRLLFGSPEQAAGTIAEWRAAGVDTVRIMARWGVYAPAPDARVAPDGFDGANHADPRYDWSALDRAIGMARGAGLGVMLTVTGWGPVWGSEYPVKDNPRFKPDPRKFAAFARAVATRYGGQVDRYIVWNEPNTTLWLQPQSQCVRRRCAPYSPHHYRRLVRAADPAIREADPGAKVLVGSLAPRGTSGTTPNGSLRPLLFLRELGCVSSKFKKVRRSFCRGFRPAGADGLAYHPHGLKLAPDEPDPVRDQAHLADLSQVTSTVDRVVRAGGLRAPARRLPLYLDEYAYQTRPPDRVLGVTASLQARYLAQSAYVAWKNPRVRNLTWYVWEDEPDNAAGGGWQSGVKYLTGRHKPAFAVFPAPFWAERARRGVARLWGQLRPGGAASVTIERRSGGGWKRVAAVRTDGRGAFRRLVRISRTTTFRFRWDGGASARRSVRP